VGVSFGGANMRRLSGWQRLGIVISIIWLVGSVTAVRVSQYSEGLTRAHAGVDICTSFEHRSFDECYAENEPLRQSARTIYWPPILLVAMVPIPVFWLLGWATFKTARWVRAGF
jgi:hypothetical protein